MNEDRLHELMRNAKQGVKHAVETDRSLIVTSHPVATEVGAELLRDGASAADAALAAALTQTVVEPQMTSIAGTMKVVYFDAARDESLWLSATHRAPSAPLSGLDGATVLGGLGVALPGWWAGFEAARERFGTRSRRRLMQPAIDLARGGVEVYPQLYGEMFERAGKLGVSQEGREVFMPRGTLLVPGERMVQERAAATLDRLADEGSDYFYRGEFAARFCAFLSRRGGVITTDDMASYEAVWSPPARGQYRGHEIVASGIPDGGLNIIEALNMVELLDVQAMDPPSQSPALLWELMLISQDVLDKGALQADPGSGPAPTETLLSKEYARMRLDLLHAAGPSHGTHAPHVGTDHISAVDSAGNVAVVMHTCTADPWCNGLFLDGISLPASAGWFTRTPAGPGRRITIDGAENIAFLDGRPVLASGSPSGSLLPCVLQNMINVIDFGMSMAQSVEQPRFGFADVGSSGLVIEADVGDRVIDELARLGTPVEVISPFSAAMGSYDAIQLTHPGLSACPDPRRTGSADGG